MANQDEYRVNLLSSIVAALAKYSELPKPPKEFEGLEDFEIFQKIYIQALEIMKLEPLEKTE